MSVPITIFIDADACPVRDEVYKIAFRHRVPVVVVSNGFLRIPKHDLISRVRVDDSFDAADDYIAEHVHENAIVITSDILLAERCVKQGVVTIAPNGKPFTPDSIGSAVAVRALMVDMRAGLGSENIGGPSAFTNADRSKFLQTLHESVEKLKRKVG